MSDKTGLENISFSRQLSLRYFNLFRLIIAAIFILAGSSLSLGQEHTTAFSLTTAVYFIAILALGFPDVLRRFGFNRIISIQVTIDIFALSIIMWSSGGYNSGMPILMMVMLAGVGLIAEGRMVLFFAALTTITVLIENAWRTAFDLAPSDFLQIGIVCIGFFAIALTARLLALRAQANASLAASRGKELTTQQSINERIIQDMQDGIIVSDEHGRIRQANTQAAALLGLPSIDNLMLTDTDPAFAHVLTEPACYAEGRLLRLGPASHLLRCRTARDSAHTEATDNILIYLTDFEEVQRQHQQLKLAALGRLTAGIAHEIRNPLAAITQATELLEDEGEIDPKTQKRLLRIINDNAYRIEHMVRDVLALGRRGHSEAENIPLDSFVLDLADIHGLQSPTERAIYTVNIPSGMTITFDRIHLQQILDNLITNARRYCTGQPGSIALYGQKNQLTNTVTLHIHDDGPGIPAEHAMQLFEPFFTSHPKGTGLGLYIAHELAEANDAELNIVNPGGSGAHFTLTGHAY